MKMVTFMKKHSNTIFSAVAMILFMAVGVALASSGGDGGHGGGHDAGSAPWLATDTYKVMNFAVLIGGLFYLARKPVAEFFSSRIQGIKEELQELETKKADAERQLAKIADKIANVDKESEEIVANYVKQGEEAKKRILEEAEAQAEKLEETAKRNIEQEFKAAKALLQKEITEKALAQAEELVKSSITPEDQDKLVDDYLDKVVA